MLLLLLLQDVDALRGAVEKAIPLLEKTTAVTLNERSCFNCHNLGMPLMALKVSGDRGFKVDAASLKAVLERTAESLKGNRDKYLRGKGVGGEADSAGWALLASSWKRRPLQWQHRSAQVLAHGGPNQALPVLLSMLDAEACQSRLCESRPRHSRRS